jgi:competence protein ComEC
MAALLIAATVTVSMLVRIAVLEHGPVAELAADEREVVVTGTLTGDPRWTQRPGFGAMAARSVLVDVRVRQVSVSGMTWQVRSPILVMGDATGWDDLRFGATVRVRGTLRPAQGTGPMSAVLFARGPPELVTDAALPLRGAEQMRSGLRDAVADMPPDVRGLLPALVVGDTSELSPDLVADLRTSGLAHLTAVSGANVGC